MVRVRVRVDVRVCVRVRVRVSVRVRVRVEENPELFCTHHSGRRILVSAGNFTQRDFSNN